MRVLIVSAALLLGACAGNSKLVETDFVEVRIPVPQPCAAQRPAMVPSLKESIGDGQWYGGLDVRQKAAAISGQGLKRQEYGEFLHAATASCPQAPDPD